MEVNDDTGYDDDDGDDIGTKRNEMKKKNTKEILPFVESLNIRFCIDVNAFRQLKINTMKMHMFCVCFQWKRRSRKHFVAHRLMPRTTKTHREATGVDCTRHLKVKIKMITQNRRRESQNNFLHSIETESVLCPSVDSHFVRMDIRKWISSSRKVDVNGTNAHWALMMWKLDEDDVSLCVTDTRRVWRRVIARNCVNW